MLVLDDLHWADQPSLALLQFVARELVGARLLIIGTYRAYFGNELIARARGDLEGARAFCERGLVISPREIRLLFDLAMLDYELGESDRGELHLSGAVELMQSSNPGPTMESSFAPYAIAYIARTEGVAGQLEMAKEIAETNLRSPMITPLLAEINQVCLSLIAVYQEDRNAASVQHDALASLTNRGVTALFGSQPDHVLGLLARTAGELDQAIGHFEDALSISRSRGYLSMLAWTCCDYADMLKERDNEGDRAKAINLLDESLAISSELGMRPLIQIGSIAWLKTVA